MSEKRILLEKLESDLLSLKRLLSEELVISNDGKYTSIEERISDVVKSNDGYDIETVKYDNKLFYDEDRNIIIKKDSLEILIYENIEEKISKEFMESFVRRAEEVNYSIVFIAKNTSIAYKNSLEIEQLNNGHFICYLSNNKENLHLIKQMIDLLCKIEKMVTIEDSLLLHVSQPIHLYKRAILKAKSILKELTMKQHYIKGHLDKIKKLVDEMRSNELENIVESF